MRRSPRPGHHGATWIALATAWALLLAGGPALAQDATSAAGTPDCMAEVEPNELPEQVPSLVGELCLSGTLPAQAAPDQDLTLWEVLPEDGMTTWQFTMKGVPTTITSVHVIPITSPPGVLPLEVSPEIFRVDSEAVLEPPLAVGETRIPPGRYVLGISRGLPFEHELTDDIGYELRLVRTGQLPPGGDVEPNDDATTATPVAGTFAVSGDLQASNDHYRWTVGPEDAAAPVRLEAQSSIGTPLTLELLTEAGEPVATTSLGPDGTATMHDLGLVAGDYLVRLSPGSGQPQPYTLAASAVADAGVDLEPNDTAEHALPIDPASLTATGRLTTDSDIDRYILHVGADLAASLIDLTLGWSDGTPRDLCLFAAAGSPLGCQGGEQEAAFRALLLPEGDYQLKVSGAGGMDDRYELRAIAVEPLPPSGDLEPNEDVATASPVAGTFAVSGDLIGSHDTLAWTVAPEDAARIWRLEATATPGIQMSVELHGPDGTGLASTAVGPDGRAAIHDLLLPAGTYALTLRQIGADPPRYVMRSVEETATDIDPEPNDSWTSALPLDPATLTARGRIAGQGDVDHYALEVDPAMAETLTEVTLGWPGDVPFRLCVLREGTPLQCRDARDGIHLTSLALPTGAYTLEVSGFADLEARYDLAVLTGPPPTEDHELEPNDLDITATTWDETQVMHADSTDGDLDTYRVTIEGEPELWRLDVTGTGLGTPSWRQPDGTGVGFASVSDDGTTALIEDLFLVQGEHLLTIAAGGDYALTLTSLGKVDTSAEREPNDDPGNAEPVAVGGLRTGRLAAPEDVDVYRFSTQGHEHVVVTAQPPSDGSVALEIAAESTLLAQVPAADPGQATVYEGLLPAADYEVWLRPGVASQGAYELRLERDDPFIDPMDPPRLLDDVEVTLQADHTEVAAFWPDGQVVDATLTIANDGATDLSLELDSTASHDAWTVELPSAMADVAAGASTSVPVVIGVAPDAPLGIPVRVTLRARGPDGAQATGFIEVTPGQDVVPVQPRQAWSVPRQLLGGLDVASLALGGQALPDSYYDASLHDGLAIDGSGSLVFFPNAPFIHGVDLAGDEPVPVAGVILDPLGQDPQYGYRPRAFELLLSADGVTFTPVLAGEMSPLLVDQPFALEESVPARFAQLRIDSTWGGTEGGISMGEWKVVAEPGFVPSEAPIDIAAWRNGGHVAWTEPQAPQQYEHLELLDEGFTAIRSFGLTEAQPVRYVIGFRDGRAARIIDLEWVDPTGADPAHLVPGVEVEVSVTGPYGPWQGLGTWDLERAADGSVAPFVLADPAWARNVRLTIPASTADPPVTSWVMPAKLRIHEQPTDDTYRSILGEWGHADPRGPYELLVRPAATDLPSDAADAPDTPEEAQSLVVSTPVDGQVRRGEDVDWFLVTIPPGDDTLRIRLATGAAGGALPVLVEESGREIDLDRARTDVPGVSTWTAIVEPGASYRLRIEQPVLSVVFVWDTSPSVEPYLPSIKAALGAFAAAITPGEEVVQILPFGLPLLLEGWSDQPYLVQGAMDALVLTGGSSEVESSVLGAAEALSERDGAHAILLLTDGVTTSFAATTDAWRGLERTATTVFPVHFGGTDDPAVSYRLMHDLADGTEGFYQYAVSQADIDRAFDRMATWMRRPAAYELSYETAFVDYPPGSLAVVPAEGAGVPLGGGISVELVLDTSGSMNKKIAGVTRMAIARETLIRLVDETLPEGLTVALRTFKAGNGSCKTVLPVPFGPLERAAMDRVIAELPLHRKTRTPLGATLHAVGDDLADRPGPKIVVFVTDGKETCKGDPEAEVERLVELGVEVALNIVGFALDDPALKSDMESWAATGGGIFVDAQDQESLLAGIAAALRAPYRVYDLDGVQVASGVVGDDPVELPTGTYRVEVLSEPPATFEEVTVPPGADIVVTIEPGAP